MVKGYHAGSVFLRYRRLFVVCFTRVLMFSYIKHNVAGPPAGASRYFQQQQTDNTIGLFSYVFPGARPALSRLTPTANARQGRPAAPTAICAILAILDPHRNPSVKNPCQNISIDNPYRTPPTSNHCQYYPIKTPYHPPTINPQLNPLQAILIEIIRSVVIISFLP